MAKKRILSLILCIAVLCTVIPGSLAYADAKNDKKQRTVYLHAQGENPTSTPDVSTVYMGETADVYFAIDNPNKGEYKNGVHTEPQYDLNGYTVTVYFDPEYFDYAGKAAEPFDYTVPDKNLPTSPQNPDETHDDSYNTPSYYPYMHKSETVRINGKTYQAAMLTVFIQGTQLPQKKDSQLWYNLCKLPLTPKKTGSTQVFFDTTGEEGKTVELFAKNTSEELSEQTFVCNYINGGYHAITIKDKNRPSAPTADLPEGKYTEKQRVALKADSDCEIWYSADGIKSENKQ